MQVWLLQCILQLKPFPLRVLMIQLWLELLLCTCCHGANEDCVVLFAMFSPPARQSLQLIKVHAGIAVGSLALKLGLGNHTSVCNYFEWT